MIIISKAEGGNEKNHTQTVFNIVRIFNDFTTTFCLRYFCKMKRVLFDNRTSCLRTDNMYDNLPFACFCLHSGSFSVYCVWLLSHELGIIPEDAYSGWSTELWNTNWSDHPNFPNFAELILVKTIRSIGKSEWWAISSKRGQYWRVFASIKQYPIEFCFSLHNQEGNPDSLLTYTLFS